MNQHVLNVRLTNNSVLGSTNDEPGTPTVIGLLKQAYNKLNTSTGNTNLNLTILQNKITSLENTVNGSESTNPPIEGLTARVSDLEDVTDDQSTAIRNNADNISLNASNITTERGRIDTLNTSLSNLSSNISTAITDLTNRITAVDKIDPNDVAHGRLKVVEDQVDHLETNVADLVAEVEGQGGALDDIIDLQADVSLLQQTVNGLHVGVGESTNQTGGERFNLYESNRNEASGDYSHAEGYLTRATGGYSHAEGSSSLAEGSSSHAEGTLTIAHGQNSHAEGNGTRASGVCTHAEGYSASSAYGAFADYSHVEGYNCKSNSSGQDVATYSHAEGYYTQTSKTAAHAEGRNTTASGNYSHAEGYYATADGECSHAGGWGTRAKGGSMTAIGKFNIIDTYDSPSSVNRLLVVGNGIGETTRSDAFVVKMGGAVIINSTRSGTTPSLQIGTSKPFTGTTAASSSSQTNDAILATKYYVDAIAPNTSTKFVYYGMATLSYFARSTFNGGTNSEDMDKQTSVFVIIHYDYNNDNPPLIFIQIPALNLNLADGAQNATSSSTFALGIYGVTIQYLSHSYHFYITTGSLNLNNPYLSLSRTFGTYQGVIFSNGPTSNGSGGYYGTQTFTSGVFITNYSSNSIQHNVAMAGANFSNQNYSYFEYRYICLMINFYPNRVEIT